MKKTLVITMALLMLIPMGISIAHAAPSGISIENLMNTPTSFNNKYVTLQGFLVAEQLMDKPTRYYLMDELNNMVQLRVSNDLGFSSLIGKEVEATGVFRYQDNEMFVTTMGVTPLEEAAPAPESQNISGELKTLVIMAYFSDRSNTENQGWVYRHVFNDMNGYYMEQSYDTVMVTGGWNGWKQLANTVQYYGQTNPSWYDNIMITCETP